VKTPETWDELRKLDDADLRQLIVHLKSAPADGDTFARAVIGDVTGRSASGRRREMMNKKTPDSVNECDVFGDVSELRGEIVDDRELMERLEVFTEGDVSGLRGHVSDVFGDVSGLTSRTNDPG